MRYVPERRGFEFSFKLGTCGMDVRSIRKREKIGPEKQVGLIKRTMKIKYGDFITFKLYNLRLRFFPQKFLTFEKYESFETFKYYG